MRDPVLENGNNGAGQVPFSTNKVSDKGLRFEHCSN